MSLCLILMKAIKHLVGKNFPQIREYVINLFHIIINTAILTDM